MHDPLWLLARQWQFGEFEGEDAGSPVSVTASWKTASFSRWKPGDDPASSDTAPGRRLEAADVLEALVETDAPPPAAPARDDLTTAAETGLRFLRDLAAAGLKRYRAAVIAEFPLVVPADAKDASSLRWRRLVAGRCPDGTRLVRAARASAPAVAARTGVAAGDRARFAETLAAWRDWVDREVGVAPQDDAWIPERLEYCFRVAARTAETETVLVAPEFVGGRIDWWSFDALPRATLGAAADAVAAEPPRTMLPSPVRFPGMPADRFWEFEDGEVFLGGIDAAPHDLARLLLVEFATAYGNDWFMVPLDLPQGSVTTVKAVTVRTTFNETYVVERSDVADAHDGTWRMFEVAVRDESDSEPPGAKASVPALVLPPAAPSIMEGPALEEVLFLRDEGANMAWAVERLIQGPTGRPVDRSLEGRPLIAERPDPSLHPEAELDYLLETNLPRNWIPLVPIGNRQGDVRLWLGALLDPITPGQAPKQIPPLGRLLARTGGRRLMVYDEEVPRAGLRVRRVPALARRADGGYTLWWGRRIGSGRGEGSSGLQFDAALPRRPTL